MNTLNGYIFFYTTPLFKRYVREAQKLFDIWIKEKRPYLIYCAGEHSLFLSRNLELSSPFFLGFIDQSETKQREGFLGHSVFSLSDAIKLDPHGILLSSYEYQEDIKEEIRKTAPNITARALYRKHLSSRITERQTPPPLNTLGGSKKDAGKRVAVIDTFFSWPPVGGSSVDLAELMNSMVLKGYEVTFFLPYIKDKLYFPRGRIFSRSQLRFDIQNIVFSQSEFEEKNFVKKVGDAVDAWLPSYVFLGDMYAFKPSLLLRLEKYRTIWRSYNYDLVCPRMTLVDRQGAPCPLSFFETPETCRECICKDTSLDWNHPILNELRLAQLFSDRYNKKFTHALGKADTIITYNTLLADRLKKFLKRPDKVEIFPTGIFPEKFFPPRNRHKSRNVTILLPGRAGDPVKGFPFYLEVFQNLREKHKGITLLITSKFDPQIDGVRSTGWLPLEEARVLYRDADFCVIPSLWEEPFGIVALEAMASGIPVIASSVGGLKGIVKDQKTGFLAEPGDFHAFSRLSEALILNPGLRERMGREGAREALNYSWDKILDRYIKKVFI